MSILPFVKGVGLGAGLIMPIGAQNSYVLNQAIKRNYHLIAASICVFFDILLMGIGVYGGGQVISSNDTLHTLITWAGILFLSGYGWMSFKMVLQQPAGDQASDTTVKSLKVVILTTLAVTLLNPHVYLDTVVILGSVGNQFSGNDKTAFTLGIMCASALWLYSLAFAGAKMSDILKRPKVRRVIDLFVALLMWGVALTLYIDWVAK